MTKKTRRLEQDPPAAGGGGAWHLLWVVIPLAILVIGAAGWFITQARATAQAQARVRELQAANQAQGLPLDYPQDIVPLYESAKVEETDRDTAKTDDGQPLDQWTIVARVEGPPKPVYEYYKQLMESRGMQQMLFASIPKGYGIQYADEQYRVEFEIEKPRTTDTFTRLKIVVYQVRP